MLFSFLPSFYSKLHYGVTDGNPMLHLFYVHHKKFAFIESVTFRNIFSKTWLIRQTYRGFIFNLIYSIGRPCPPSVSVIRVGCRDLSLDYLLGKGLKFPSLMC